MIEPDMFYRPAPLHILTCGRYSSMHTVLRLSSSWTFAAFSWGTANLARYQPLVIPVRFTVARFMSPNSNATGTVDMGLYSAAGVKLISTGNTARAGTSAMQYIDVPNQSFPPGNYYLAMVCSSTTSQVFRNQLINTTHVRLTGLLEQALGSAVLPSSMTPATSVLNGDIPVWGFTQSDTL